MLVQTHPSTMRRIQPKRYIRSGCSLKYELSRQSSAVARLFGSYMNRKLSSRIPASDSQENLWRRLLYLKFSFKNSFLKCIYIFSNPLPYINYTVLLKHYYKIILYYVYANKHTMFKQLEVFVLVKEHH